MSRARPGTTSLNPRRGEAADGCALSEARLTVDTDALADNFATLRRLAGPAEIAPVVKADAYGLGLAPVALRLWDEGARSFFVARVAEGHALRVLLGSRRADIYVFDGCPHGMAGALNAARLTPVLNSVEQVAEFAAAAPREGATACLHLDTGLNRLGLAPEEVEALVTSPDRLARLDITLVLSHLACANAPDHPMNARQRERFIALAAYFPLARRSLANSAGVFLGPAYAFDLVRPGVSLYGGGPCDTSDPRLSPVVRLEAPILQIRHIAPGETVGYGATFTATRPMRVAIVGAGYADGVLRASGPRGYGVCAGRRLPFVGRISMDLLAMDATGTPSATAGVAVELIGAGVSLDEAAQAAGTLSYELLVRIGARVARRYVSARQ